MKKILINIIMFFITLYQNTFSLLFPGTCRFQPSCSNYMKDTIKKFGIIKGIRLGLKRIAKCHPFSKANTWDPA